MPNTFKFANIADLAGSLILSVHPHLAGIPIVFRFFSDEKKKAGRLVLGTAGKLSPIERHAYAEVLERFPEEVAPLWIAGIDYAESGQLAEGFVISIYEKWWKRQASEAQRAALLDHELSHCFAEEGEEGEMVLTIVGHDIEEFYGVLARHGDWKGEAEHVSQAITKSQLTLWQSDDDSQKQAAR